MPVACTVLYMLLLCGDRFQLSSWQAFGDIGCATETVEERIRLKIRLATQLIIRMVLQCIKKLSSLRTEFLVS